MFSVQIKMETNSFNSIESYRYHIHNYSSLAIRTFIGEIQKYPIIFSSKNGLTLKKELVEFAWTRITVALLDTVVPTHQKVALINMDYWNQSFRQLWKWMLNIYFKEQFENRLKSPKIMRIVKYQWLDFMCFLDPYLRHNNGISSNCTDINSSSIRLQILPAETKIIHLQSDNHIILWLRKFSESINSKNTCISVCLEIQRCFSPPLPPSVEAMLRQDVDIDESLLVKYTDGPYFISNSFQPQMPYLPVKIKQYQTTYNNRPKVVPSFESVIDMDFLYIISLHSKLTRLEPARKSKVKRLMIFALNDAL